MSDEAYPHAAGAKGDTTSHDAAEKIERRGRAGHLRAAVLAWYLAGHRGTADECAAALGEGILTIRPRVSELYRQGKLIRTVDRHHNASGTMARVMAAKMEST